MRVVLDKNGAIVTERAEAARVFYRLLNECECDWRMEWFPHLGSFDGLSHIVSILCDEYAREHNYYGNGRNRWWELMPNVRDKIVELAAPLCDPVRMLFYRLYPRMKSADMSPYNPDYHTQQALKNIRSFCDQLTQFFIEENGSIELIEELR